VLITGEKPSLLKGPYRVFAAFSKRFEKMNLRLHRTSNTCEHAEIYPSYSEFIKMNDNWLTGRIAP